MSDERAQPVKTRNTQGLQYDKVGPRVHFYLVPQKDKSEPGCALQAVEFDSVNCSGGSLSLDAIACSQIEKGPSEEIIKTIYNHVNCRGSEVKSANGEKLKALFE